MNIKKKTMSDKTRITIGVILSILSGLFMFLAYPPVNFWPLIFFVAVPYLIAQYRLMPRRWSAVAPAISTTLWLWPYLARIYGIPDAPFIFRHMGLFFGLLSLLTSTERRFNELTNYKWFVLQGIFAWVGFEMIRSLIPILGTIGFSGNTLASQAWFTQPISIFSIYGLNMVIVLVNFTSAYLALAWVDKRYKFENTVRVDPKPVKTWSVITAIVVILWVATSLLMYTRPIDTPTIRVAALHQYEVNPGHQVDEGEQVERIKVYSQKARQAADEGAQAIFFPEMGFGFNPQTTHAEELRALAIETYAYLFIPYAYHDEGEDGGWHNETVILDPNGDFSTRYGKLHPFGEPRTVTAGTFPVKETELGTMGSIICMDGVFTDAAKNVTSNGAQILGIPTYNTTVGISEHNWTHFVMRSIENRVPVVTSDRGLVSMITDPRGNVLAKVNTPKGGDDVLVADVPLGTGTSPYHKVGDWLGWVNLAGFAFFMVFQTVIEQRSKKQIKQE